MRSSLEVEWKELFESGWKRHIVKVGKEEHVNEQFVVKLSFV
jgi:hypothetical protein